MLFKLVHQKWGQRAYFHAIVPQSATYLYRKPGSIEKKPHLFVRALVTRKILRSKDAQCNSQPRIQVLSPFPPLSSRIETLVGPGHVTACDIKFSIGVG